MATAFGPRFDPGLVERMHSLLKLSTLPEEGVEFDDKTDIGVKLDWLKEARARLEAFDVGKLEADLNQYHHFTAPIEETTIHFIHEPSSRPDAIPLLILHGWPGTFWDFHKIIKELAKPSDSTLPAFHVVAPSLPGFAWSTLPRKKVFGLDDTARIFNKLMVDVLGYKEYVGQGGDWGNDVLRYIGKNHSEHAPLILWNMFHCPPAGISAYSRPTLRHLPIPSKWADGIQCSLEEWGLPEAQVKNLRRRREFPINGRGYIALQNSRPATIGYALASSPLGLLAYIGEKFLAWSDPRSLDIDDLLATVVLYYLTSSFPTSVMIYLQSGPTVEPIEGYDAWGGWRIKSKMGFSAFPYEMSAPPESWIAKCGPLVQYKVHDKGGHFPALDNPDALVRDLREFVDAHWMR